MQTFMHQFEVDALAYSEPHSLNHRQLN